MTAFVPLLLLISLHFPLVFGGAPSPGATDGPLGAGPPPTRQTQPGQPTGVLGNAGGGGGNPPRRGGNGTGRPRGPRRGGIGATTLQPPVATTPQKPKIGML